MAREYLASDANNPDFIGAKNPDGALGVRFYREPHKNEFLSAKENRPIFQDVDMIEILIPGDDKNIVHQPVREDHKERFPIHWAHYQNKIAGDPREIGTPLSQWTKLMPAQVEELRALRFYTVESIANASDQQIQSIGMAGGMGHFAFRDAAQRFLRLAHDNAALQKAEEAAQATEVKLAEERAAREVMEAKMLEMQAQLAALAPKKKAGRPPKVKTVVE